MPVRDSRAAAAIALFWVAFGATAWGGSGAAWAVAPGEAAPAFALPTADAGPVSLEALRGRVVYVDFWASWCGPCRRSFPFMNELKERYADRGLTIVAVNVDAKREDAARFLRQYPATFAVVYDPTGETPRAYDVKAMPSSYVVDRAGRVVAIEHGFLEERRAPIEERIRALLAER